MKKVSALRDFLLQSALDLQPEDVVCRVKNGQLRTHYRHPQQAPNQKIRLEYSAEVLIMDYHQAPEALFELLARWLSESEHGHSALAIQFEAEILDHEKVDLLFTIKGLTDYYHAEETAEGIHITNPPQSALDLPYSP